MHPFQFTLDRCPLVSVSAKETLAAGAVPNFTAKWVALLISIQKIAGLYLFL
jgi:hypothetical protein